MALAHPPSLPSCAHTSSIHSSGDPSWDGPQVHSSLQDAASQENTDRFPTIDSVSALDSLRIDGIDALAARNSKDAHPLVFQKAPVAADPTTQHTQISIGSSFDPNRQGIICPSDPQYRGPFQRWMRSLHRRASHRKAPWDPYEESRHSPQPFVGNNNQGSLSRRLTHHKSSSGSSFGFVSAIQSASMSLASASAVTRSRKHTTRSHCQSRTDYSSRASLSGPRFSEDSTAVERSVVDPLTLQRASQRTKILEELVSTEESYIGDIRFLMNVYITILASLPTLSIRMRSSINRNLTEIVELHEEILGDLHRIIPYSEYTQTNISLPIEQKMGHGIGHRRWWSHDAGSIHPKGAAWLHSLPSMLSDPQVAAEVAKLFSKKMNRFFIYKEYGAKYEMMIRDLASVHESMPEWETYQKGLETLASTLGSAKTSRDQTNKSLTIGDLLVKPIQRICKYPLLFAELLKCTPVCDCPNSNMEVETALMRIREATTEINRATNDGCVKETLGRTWLLQDRLVFPGRKLDAVSKNQIRSFGHVQLCGTLHICWQEEDKIQGKYMICLLYRDTLCLASAGKVDQIYTIQACINVHTAKIEDINNGRGLQCHRAPFSWKLEFESDHQLYEVIMSASSSKEELEWRARLYRPPSQIQDSNDLKIFGTLHLNIKSLGTVARRISVHRATTAGPKCALNQVVLKNTSNATTRVPSSTSINRSQSLLTTNSRITVLAPTRDERIRIETLLANIWSRDILPYPGMAPKTRSDHLVRNSASTMMRKLSVASISGSFSKKAGTTSPRCPNTEDSENSGNGRLTKRPRTQSVHEKVEFIQSPGTETSQRFDLTKLTVDVKTKSDERILAAVLDSPSTVSPRSSSSPGLDKSDPCLIEKENACPPPNNESKKQGRRWGKAGGLRNDGMGRGLRSLFR
ncbi:hypothetical protein BGZ63DRAFT_409851 [Mariannaea sp. PMI_226]|nr:hypothetical protein BGZ63DRAFT_409851 [Mariannaea sp. PMI_226]